MPPQVPIRALLFDLDGTLYSQAPLRTRMLLELAAAPFLRGPRGARRLARILGTFRSEREKMRGPVKAGVQLERRQYEVVAERLAVPADEVAREVGEWMLERPLKHLQAHRRPGIVSFLRKAQDAGLALGVFSDYPVQAKLKALGLDGFFPVQRDATDLEINAFKPDPKGFLFCAAELGVEANEVLYVGDRADVDGEGARRAGMKVVLVDEAHCDDGHRYAGGYEEVWRVVRSYQ